jgi:ribosomal protein L11 methyltransferase
VEQYVQVAFTVQSNESLELNSAFEIIAAILHEEEFESFEFLDNKLIGYIKEKVWEKESIGQRLSSLPFAVSLDAMPVVNQNWNTLWEQQIKPIEIGREIYIYPSFSSPESSRTYQLVIDPKMAFGTGYHDTTRMVLETMEEMVFDNQSVLDFGCGTGILAVYASMRGASKVVGIDNDLIAVESARDVAKANHQEIELRYQENDGYQHDGKIYDCILANVNKNAIDQNIEVLLRSLHPEHGNILLSGLLLDDWAWVEQRMKTLGLKLVDKRASSAWLALRWKV